MCKQCVSSRKDDKYRSYCTVCIRPDNGKSKRKGKIVIDNLYMTVCGTSLFIKMACNSK